MITELTSLSVVFRNRRNELGLSLEKAARISGVGKASIGRIEKGNYHPKDEIVKKISVGLGLDPGETLLIDRSDLKKAAYEYDHRRYCKDVVSNRSYMNQINRGIRDAALDHYGGECSCCGELLREFLTIDHINNDGAEHRKTLHPGSIYRWLRKNNYPDGFQVLCRNCNWGKHVNSGVCPHLTE